MFAGWPLLQKLCWKRKAKFFKITWHSHWRHLSLGPHRKNKNGQQTSTPKPLKGVSIARPNHCRHPQDPTIETWSFQEWKPIHACRVGSHRSKSWPLCRYSLTPLNAMNTSKGGRDDLLLITLPKINKTSPLFQWVNLGRGSLGFGLFDLGQRSLVRFRDDFHHCLLAEFLREVQGKPKRETEGCPWNLVNG